MTNQHPITPPLQLVEQWASMSPKNDAVQQNWIEIATQAARWGADQELEACCEFLRSKFWIESELVDELRAARRPKALGLKEQALEELDRVDMLWDTNEFGPSTLSSLDTIRRALEQLDD
jgi:hypothetical protein